MHLKRIGLYVCCPNCPVAPVDGTGVNGKHKIKILCVLRDSAVRKTNEYASISTANMNSGYPDRGRRKPSTKYIAAHQQLSTNFTIVGIIAFFSAVTKI